MITGAGVVVFEIGYRIASAVAVAVTVAGT